MSFPAIITGLLVWFSLPPLFKKGLDERAYRIVCLVCKILGIMFIVGGIAWSYFK